MKILNGLLFCNKRSIIDVQLGYIQAFENIYFQSEAKVEQVIVIVTTCSVSCFRLKLIILVVKM